MPVRAALQTTEPGLGPLTGHDRVVLGVARDLADRFQLEPIVVRLAFVTLTVAGGWGAVVYVLVWLAARPAGSGAGAVATAAMTARAPGAAVRTLGVVVGLAGTLLLLRARGWGFVDELVWPTALVCCGLMLAWNQLIPTAPGADHPGAHRPDARIRAEGRGPAAVLGLGAGHTGALVRVGGGAALLLAGLTYLLATSFSIGRAADAVLAGVTASAGLVLLFGPWVARLTRTATEEHTRRIRADERAEMAAHLHDSVLQTLTLMQKQASDPVAVANLARRQERELRRWLYTPGDRADPGDGAESLLEALENAAVEVEDLHGIRIDVVTVGDVLMSPALGQLVAATREALVNAAKFSGERQVALYAEARAAGPGDPTGSGGQTGPDDPAAPGSPVDPAASNGRGTAVYPAAERQAPTVEPGGPGDGRAPLVVQVFVRDRGRGFDRATVPPDRRGLSDSMEGRMARVGGHAVIRSSPGAGTEVMLQLTCEPGDAGRSRDGRHGWPA